MIKNVLIVEDERDFQDLLQYHLEDERYQLHFAENWNIALNKARSLLPDLIILDVLLPDLDGLTLCATLRSQPSTRSIPIWMMSAASSDITRHAAIAAGANEFFRKPIKLPVFKEKVAQTLFAPLAETA